MTFRLEIKCDGAAFEGNPASEFQGIFNRLVVAVACCRWPTEALNGDFVIHDINGNRVGVATLTED